MTASFLKEISASYHKEHGTWIYFYDDGIKRCKCSECLTSYGCLDTPYCPNCGASMIGDEISNDS